MGEVTLAVLAADAASCTACRLSETRTTVVFGVGGTSSGLLVVGEGPGKEEDLRGEPFVGRSGQLLDRLVYEELGLTRESFYIANVVKCRPPGNRDPAADEVAACARFLDGQLALVDPRVVVSLGNVATRLLLGTEEGISSLRGRTHPWRGRTLVPTFHPAYALRGGGAVVAQMRADLVRAKQALAASR
ncbi:MAG TPA: uracil-DNA glycosylase [Acidimicrobiales bacterium]|jgi:DNA polymerase